MAQASRVVAAPAEMAWRVLADGWLYPLWVVGASHMRDVDAAYPAVGSALHHAVGAWPLLIRDDTTVEESDPPRRLVLMARAWPFGQARVTLEVAADPGGCLLTMKEEPVAGPGQWLHRMVQPVSEAALAHRNAECLDRLAAIIEHRNPALLPSAATS